MDKNKKLFPQRLWELIHDEKYNFCLRWSPDGQRVYLNRNEFETHYLRTSGNQFHTQKAISFVRQMNMYGFKKVDDYYYENDNFKRNCHHLLKNMVRRNSSKGLFGTHLHHGLQSNTNTNTTTSTRSNNNHNNNGNGNGSGNGSGNYSSSCSSSSSLHNFCLSNSASSITGAQTSTLNTTISEQMGSNNEGSMDEQQDETHINLMNQLSHSIYRHDNRSPTSCPISQANLRNPTTSYINRSMTSLTNTLQARREFSSPTSDIAVAMAAINANAAAAVAAAAAAAAAQSPLASTLYQRLSALNSEPLVTSNLTHEQQQQQRQSDIDLISANHENNVVHQTHHLDTNTIIAQQIALAQQQQQLLSQQMPLNIADSQICAAGGVPTTQQTIEESLIRSWLQLNQNQLHATLEQSLLASLQQQRLGLIDRHMRDTILAQADRIQAHSPVSPTVDSPLELVVSSTPRQNLDSTVRNDSRGAQTNSYSSFNAPGTSFRGMNDSAEQMTIGHPIYDGKELDEGLDDTYEDNMLDEEDSVD